MEVIGLLIYLVFAIVILGISAGTIFAWFYGLILAFQAHIILGIVCLFLEPAYIIFALVKWITGEDLAKKIVAYFSD